MENATETWLCHFCACVFVIAFGTLVLGCGHNSPEKRYGDERQSTGPVTSLREPLLISINNKPKGKGDQHHDAKLLESLAIAGDGDLVALRVTFEGKDYPFMLDTGAIVHTFDLSLKHCFGNPIRTGLSKFSNKPYPGDLRFAPGKPLRYTYH